jgi:hypothetical protein
VIPWCAWVTAGVPPPPRPPPPPPATHPATGWTPEAHAKLLELEQAHPKGKPGRWPAICDDLKASGLMDAYKDQLEPGKVEAAFHNIKVGCCAACRSPAWPRSTMGRGGAADGPHARTRGDRLWLAADRAALIAPRRSATPQTGQRLEQTGQRLEQGTS